MALRLESRAGIGDDEGPIGLDRKLVEESLRRGGTERFFLLQELIGLLDK